MPTTMYMFDLKTGEYTGSRAAQAPGGKEITKSTSATIIAPPTTPAGKIARWTGTAWVVVEDHRQKMDAQGTKQGGTPYWLPGDTWQSPPRYTEDLGPLPTGALFEAPAKTADEVKGDQRNDILRQLAALDTQYLTPRTLAGLTTGDEYAAAQKAAHEAEAAPLRAALAAL